MSHAAPNEGADEGAPNGGAPNEANEDARRVFPRWVIALAALLVVGMVLYSLRAVLTPVFFAFLIAYALDPVVDRLERWRLPRAAAIVVLLVAVLTVLGLFLLLVLPGVVRDVADFARELPGAMRATLESWTPVLESYGVSVPHSCVEAMDQLSADADGIARDAITPAAAVLRAIVGGTANALAAFFALLMVPVFSFYLLYDFDRMIAAMGELVPYRHRPLVGSLAREVDDVIGQWIRGQLSVMLVLAILYSVGYVMLGVRLAVPIGITAGLLAFIPYVGGAAALGLALGMCAFDFQGWGQIGGVVAVYAVIQALEGLVITPKIVGDKVGLSAVWVLFALMVAGEIFGFMGVLLAVPAAAVVKIFVMRGVAAYRESEAFGEPPPEEPEAEADADADADPEAEADADPDPASASASASEDPRGEEE